MSEFKNSTLLTAYYDRIASSLASLTSCPKLYKFKFGNGYIDESVDPPALLPVPTDPEPTDIPDPFFEAVFAPEDVSYSDGRIILKCFMPVGSVAEPKKYSVTGIYDQDDNLLIVMQDLPDWLTPEDEHTAYCFIDFPNIGENPPTPI